MLLKISEADYRAKSAISQSFLKDVLSYSGMELQHRIANPKPPTEKMIKGTMAHAIALEGHQIAFKDYAIDKWPSLTGKKRSQNGEIDGKEMSYQTYKKALLALNKTYIKEEEIHKLEGVVKAIERDFSKILVNGRPEIAIVDVELNGEPCKGLLDFLPEKSFIFDLKITSKPLSDGQIFRFLYQDNWVIQAAFYHDLYELVTDESRPFVFLIAQDVEPYCTRKVVVTPSSKAMEAGRERYIKAMELFKGYKDLDIWPGYSTFNCSKMEG